MVPAMIWAKVQETIEGLGSSIKVSTIDWILLVDVEPVRREEHVEEKQNEWLQSDGFPETN
jgi:hypothetical protein